MLTGRFWSFLFGLLIVAGSCSTNPVELESGLSFEERQQIAENAVSMYVTYRETLSPEKAKSLLLEDLKQNVGITNVGASSDSVTIWWETLGAIPYIYITETSSDLASGSANKSVHASAPGSPHNYKTAGLPDTRNALSFPHTIWSFPGGDGTGAVNKLLKAV